MNVTKAPGAPRILTSIRSDRGFGTVSRTRVNSKMFWDPFSYCFGPKFSRSRKARYFCVPERAEMLIWAPAHDKDLKKDTLCTVFKKRHTVYSVRAYIIRAYRIKCVFRSFFAQAEAAKRWRAKVG